MNHSIRPLNNTCRGCLVTLVVMLAHSAHAAAPSLDNDSIVINEISVSPGPDYKKFVEITNLGDKAVDLFTWWICDQPSTLYVRLTQIPSYGGEPQSPGIVLAPGDFLVLHFDGPPPGGYAIRINQSGTVTHIVNLGAPPHIVLSPEANNFSLWDQVTPNTPWFDVPTLIRDIAAWQIGGVYDLGPKRCCVGSQAGLWPPPFEGDCVDDPEDLRFVAVDSTPLVPGCNLSVNYNGGSNNDPSDYFTAPATEGERNVMPGDLDDDFDMDNADFEIFVDCMSSADADDECERADFDGSGEVNCGDWRCFLEDWRIYSRLDPPELPACEACLRGDLNSDAAVDLFDFELFSACFTGPNGGLNTGCECANMDCDSDVDLADFAVFQVLFGDGD